MQTLTPKQKQILDFLTSYIKENGYSPSLEEIARKFKKTIPTIFQHIENLKSKGFLLKTDNISRGIQLNNAQDEVMLLGKIAAGIPIEAIENPEPIKIPAGMLNTPGNYYALLASGNSMIEDGIFDGDTVIIKHQNTAEDGDTIVAITEDGATLKKLYRDGKRIRLQPANQTFLPIFPKEIEIKGKVIGILRNIQNNANTLNSLADRKLVFLNRIKSANPESQNKYKRVALSPIRYAGGKSLAVGYVVELIPNNIKRVISPFFGGGSIEIAISKYLGLEVIGYDIFDILCNYWEFQIKKPKLLYDRLKELKPNKKTFEKIRLILNDVWNKKIKLDPLTLAVYFLYNFNLSYGPGFMGWSSDIYLDEKKYKRMIERIRDFVPLTLEVKCADFQQVIRNHPNDFLYCDPPYYIGEDSKMFKGIYPMRNIPVHHNGFPHEILRDLLRNHKGGFVLSYNNCPTIREYYKEFQQSFPSWQYTMGQGETRIGKNRKNGNGNHIKESHEIIIYCPPRI